jgi:hypothetical protein
LRRASEFRRNLSFSTFNRRFVNLGAAFIDYDNIAGRRTANVDCDLAGDIFRDFFCLLLILAIQADRIFDLITVHNLEMKLGHRHPPPRKFEREGTVPARISDHGPTNALVRCEKKRFCQLTNGAKAMVAEGFGDASDGQKSKDFSVLPDHPNE